MANNIIEELAKYQVKVDQEAKVKRLTVIIFLVMRLVIFVAVAAVFIAIGAFFFSGNHSSCDPKAGSSQVSNAGSFEGI